MDSNSETITTSLTSCDPKGAGYMTNRERFLSDAATDEAIRRKAEIIKKNRMIELKREQERQRIEESDKELVLKQQREQVRLDALQKSPLALTNVSGCGYGIINLLYHTNQAGSEQKQADDLIKFRAAERQKNLQRHGSRVGYNIISGEEL